VVYVITIGGWLYPERVYVIATGVRDNDVERAGGISVLVLSLSVTSVVKTTGE
jgi:hypothetical protein